MAECCPPSRGVALVEATVSLLVLSLASVTMASLQLSASKANFEAAQRTTATAFAADMLERMRANPNVLVHYAIDEMAADEASSAPVLCSGESCSAADLARRDLRDWGDALQGRGRGGEPVTGGLRDASACIAISGRIAEVVIAWSGQGLTERTAENGSCTDDHGERRLLLRMQGFIPERAW